MATGQQMGWIRPRIGTGAWLALIALAMQFVLAFGHNHFGHHGDGLSAAAKLVAGYSSSPPAGPDRDDGDGLAADGCAICATLALAATAVAAAPPLLALPTPVTISQQPSPLAAVPTTASTAAFRSRAPPRLTV